MPRKKYKTVVYNNYKKYNKINRLAKKHKTLTYNNNKK